MMRLAWFSPIVDDAESLSSHITGQMRLHAPGHAQLSLFIDSLSGDGAHYQKAFLADAEALFDTAVCLVDDSAACSFSRIGAALYPGLLWLNDVDLSRLTAAGQEGVVQQAEREDGAGDEPECTSAELPVGVAAGVRLARMARTVVVSSDGLGRYLRERGVACPIELLLPPIELPTAEECRMQRQEFRALVDAGPDDIYIGYQGRFLLEDEMFAVGQAVVELQSRIPERAVRLLWLVAAGAEGKAVLPLIQRVTSKIPELERHVMMHRVDSQRSLCRAIAGCDLFAAITRQPLRGVRLGTYRALAHGVVTIVSNFGVSRELPDAAVLKCDCGTGEALFLARLFEEVVRNARLAAQLRRAGRAFISECCSPQEVSHSLWSVLRRHQPRLRGELERRRGRTAQIKRELALAASIDVAAENPHVR